jgi:hypothetical protein
MEPQNNGHWLTKTAIKHKNVEFFVMPLKHVMSIMDLVISPEPQNCGQ